MKHTQNILIIMLLLCVTAIAQNLLLNGDFESGTLNNWTHVQGGESAVSTNAYSGSYACKIQDRGTLEQVVENLKSGTDYILTLYTKCGDNGRSNPGAKDYGRGKSAKVLTDTTWQRVELRFRTSLESTTAKVYVTNLRNGAVIYADNFQLVEDTHSAFETTLPKPPAGYHWEMLPDLSDEFNDDELDESKWLNYHPYWSGREPSHHHRDNVWLADGYLALENTSRIDDMSEINDPEKDVWVDAACVTSKERNVSFGYYEARMREAMISMTSAFWFQGKYSEIDVVENLGAPSNNNGHENQMRMNTHYYIDGWDNDQKTPRDWLMPYPAGEDFHVYGVWWIDETRLNFYHNGVLVEEIELPGDYDEPMYMFFDTEVFTWEGLPTIESLNNPDLNTMYVDWVRSWELVPGEPSSVEESKHVPQELQLYSNYPNPFNPSTLVRYHLNQQSNVSIQIINAKGEQVRELETSQIKTAGSHTCVWDAKDDTGNQVASGVYLLALKANEQVKTQKMLLMK